MKTIGILGGTGPVATEELYNRIMKIFQLKYKSVQDHEYPPIILYSLPLRGTDETGIVDEILAFKDFSFGIKKLIKAGCGFIIIPCNTVHHLMDKLKNNIKIPVLSITEAILQEILKSKIKKVGILSSETSYRLKLHERGLEKRGIDCIIPSQEEKNDLTNVILNVMGGNGSMKDKKIISNIINKMKNNGAKSIVVGCTELSVLIKQKDSPLKLFDGLQILAERAVEESRN